MQIWLVADLVCVTTVAMQAYPAVTSGEFALLTDPSYATPAEFHDLNGTLDGVLDGRGHHNSHSATGTV